MNDPLRTPEDYELFLYTLTDQFPSVRRSTVVFIRRGATLARVTNDPALQITHPHHKHIPPDIKHNRAPAPEMSFNQPNLPALIREIETLIKKIETEAESKQG